MIIIEPGTIKALCDPTATPTSIAEMIYDHHSLDPQFPDMANPHVHTLNEIITKLVSLVQVAFNAIGRVKSFSTGNLTRNENFSVLSLYE